MVVKNNTNVVNDEPKDNTICKYCNKKLCDRIYRWKHEKKCKENNTLQNNDDANKTINNTSNSIQNAKNIQNNIQNNIDNKQIVINNFGNNNLECLTEEFKKKLLKEFIFEEDHLNIIPTLIEKINFNLNYKENNNAKISNLRSKIGYKFTGGIWKVVEKEKLLNDLFKIGDETIDNIINDLKHIPINIQDGYENFIGKKDLLKKQIKTKLEVACYLYFKNLEDNEYEENDIEL